MRRLVPGLLLTAIITLWYGCGNFSNPGTAPTPRGLPSLVCPTSISITGVTVPTLIESYSAPVEVGGTPPVNVSCQPAAGSAFPVGNTTVTCTATDALKQTATCSFHVTISAQQLAAMTFVAFGDSITAGENGLNCIAGSTTEPCTAVFTTCPQTSVAGRRVASVGQARPNYIDVPNSYPTVLQTMLDNRFVGEGITVINEGSPGETSAGGLSRLPCVLSADQPNALLILEGINDINSTTGAADITGLIGNLGLMISKARSVRPAPTYIFLSTILPILPSADDEDCGSGGTEPPCRNDGMITIIQAANFQIAQLAQMAGVPLVDAYTAFVTQDPNLTTLIGPDGLHPQPPGNQLLALTFYDQIVANVPVTSRYRRR